MKNILVLSALLALGGCVVVPAHQAYYQPVEPAVVEVEPVYMWDAALGAFFFFDVYGHRSYMHHGWAPRGHGHHY